MTKIQERLYVIDALRGLASLGVCWFHLTLGLDDGLLKLSGAYGWLGVEVFFVISGFVIPYALYRADYRLKHYGYFIIKRLLRLDPPYIVTVAIIVALGYLSPFLPGTAKLEHFNLSVPQLLLHFGYVNVFFGYPWLNMVFWSLAIEFQYYLLIALIFPLIGSKSDGGGRFYPVVFTALAVSSFLIPSNQFIFHYLFLFLLGIITFQYQVGLISRTAFLLLLLLFTCGNYLSIGMSVAVVGALTALIIAFVRTRIRALGFLGMISYSLYLLHVPIGYRAISLGSRLVKSTDGMIGVLIFAVGLCIVASYILYVFVEKPSQRLASSINFRRLKQAETSEALIDQPAL